MLAAPGDEARTDELTGLGNRRRLARRPRAAARRAARAAVLALFDLNGFKQYNDSFGHPAGDALLARLGDEARPLRSRRRGTRVPDGRRRVLRRRPRRRPTPTHVVAGAARALAEHGDGFAITAAFGAVRSCRARPPTPAEALRLADQRMYAQKQSVRESGRRAVERACCCARSPSATRSSTSTRRRRRRSPRRSRWSSSSATAEVARVRLAGRAARHRQDGDPRRDPRASRAALTEDELEFMRRHTLIGERILHAAPALAARRRHRALEPRALRRHRLPGRARRRARSRSPSRIIFVCDAFDAMTSRRPYAQGADGRAALAELQRCAGTQFDPAVVEAFAELLAERESELQPPRRPRSADRHDAGKRSVASRRSAAARKVGNMPCASARAVDR